MPAIKVFLYKNDYNAMCAEIYRHQRIETGGNLFGLWTTSGDVVIYAALGPGKGCRRTEHSFHQDIPYLERVGRFLNDRYMLCHVGEWRSHHQLSLKEPSTGDVRTVWDNYPLGMKKFLVIIGNLVASDQVLLSPYFFLEGRRREYVKGKFEVLEDENPFTLDLDITRVMEKGSEGQEREIRRGVSVENDYSRDTSNNARLPPSDHVSSHENHDNQSLGKTSTDNEAGTTTANNTAPRTTAAARNVSNDSTGIIHPPRDYAKGSANNGTSLGINATTPPTTATLVSMATTTISTTTFSTATTSNPSTSAQVTFIKNTSSGELSSNDTVPEDNQQTRQEAIIQKLHENIKSHFSNQIDMERTLPGMIKKMKFKHNNKFWLIEIPNEFPNEPAKIFISFNETFNSKWDIFLVPFAEAKFLNNHINIILTIQRHCKSSSSYCSFCKLCPISLLTGKDPEMFLTEKGLSLANEYKQKVESNLADKNSLKTEIFAETWCGYISEEPVAKISFKHQSKIWIVKLKSTFPDSEAKAFCIDDDERCRSRYERSLNLSSYEKNFVSQVLVAISQNCCCDKCKRLKDFISKS